MRSTTVLALAVAAAPVVLAAPLPLAARDTEFLNDLVARKAGGGGRTNWRNVAAAVDETTAMRDSCSLKHNISAYEFAIQQQNLV